MLKEQLMSPANPHRITALLCGLLCGPVFAGSATIEAGSGRDRQQVQFEYQGERLRMQPKAQAEGTMILRDGKIYAIAQNMVFDLADMQRMLGEAAMQAPQTGPDDLVRYLGLDSTGRNETIAGASGTVHILRYADREGREHREELVLSNDARARELAGAMQKLSDAMRRTLKATETPGEAQLQAQINNRGVLRYGTEFRVVSFGGEPSANRFELPSAPQRLPSLEGLGGNAESGEAADGSVLGKLFGQKAQRQQERVEQRSDAEVDRATDDAVDGVLNKAFDKLFSR